MPSNPERAERGAGQPQQFRKKPVVIDAVQWRAMGDHPAVFDYTGIRIEGGRPDCTTCGEQYSAHGWCPTLEGHHIVCPGDWIITGIKGEHYPCKPDIFAATYEPAALSVPDAPRGATGDANLREFIAGLGVSLNVCGGDATPEAWRELGEYARRTLVKSVPDARTVGEPAAFAWREGAPPKPWCNEWFLATMRDGQPVVLKALPEDYSYGFKTADDTYVKAANVKRWAQLTNSEFAQYALPARGTGA